MLILSASLVAVVMGTADKTQRKENYALETVEPNANAGELPIDETLSIGDTTSTNNDTIYDTETPSAQLTGSDKSKLPSRIVTKKLSKTI